MASSPALDVRWRPGPGTPALCELLHACLDDFAPLAVQEHETLDGWRVFFRTSVQRDQAAASILGGFADQLDGVRGVEVEDEDWARRSQAGLTAIRIGRLVVAPPWESAEADILVVIDPSTGFGTGHHETTRLCLGILQTLDVEGCRVIDVGTGSGVLAIAAATLGANGVVAIDNDPDALDNALDNVRRNDCDRIVEIRSADLASFAAEPADIVTANLTAAVLTRNAARLTELLKPGGMLIASGFGPDEVPAIASAFSPLSEYSVARDGDWAAIALRASA